MAIDDTEQFACLDEAGFLIFNFLSFFFSENVHTRAPNSRRNC
jgi:hypothetical protein